MNNPWFYFLKLFTFEILLKLFLLTFKQVHLQAMLHVHCQGKFWHHRVLLCHPHTVAEDDGGGGVLHLVVGKVLPQAQPRPAVEGGEPIRRLGYEPTVSQPSLGLEFSTIFPPYGLHSAHCIYCIDHFCSFL